MSIQEVMKKISKLLRLAQSKNINESAVAAAQAQKLMDKYKIEASMAALAGEEPELPDEDIINCPDPLDSLRQRVAWKNRLAGIIARASQCRIYTQGGRDVMIVGRPLDIQAVRYLYSYMTREIERLCDEECKGCGRTYRNNFRLGAVDTIAEKLRDQKKNTEFELKQRARVASGMSALVRVETAIAKIEKRGKEVDQWMGENMKLYRTSVSRSQYSHSARSAGRQAAKGIAVNRARGAIGG